MLPVIFDVLFSKWVDRATLTDALVYAFELPSDEIIVLFDITAILGVSSRCKLITLIYSTPGVEFPCYATINIDDSDVSNFQGLNKIQHHIQLAEMLSRFLKCSCVISDDDSNPYSWILVTDGEPPMSVFEVSDERADEGDFKIDRVVGLYFSKEA